MERLTRLTLAAALTAYLQEVPEYYCAPELLPLRRDMDDLRRKKDDAVSKMVYGVDKVVPVAMTL